MRRLASAVYVALVGALVVVAAAAALARLWLEAGEPSHSFEHFLWHTLTPLGLATLVVAVAALPLVRRLTRRLELLRSRVEALGAGELGTRVEVEGDDEVAALARSFNRSAERIEALVAAERRLLAGVSHELRSPLARLRMAIELVAGGGGELGESMARDVAELDDLIGELLLAGRLEAPLDPAALDEVDLLGLLAEEAAGEPGIEVRGTAVVVRGERRWLRRLVRNLLDNARRHGHPPISASVSPLSAGGGRLRVRDAGAGVPGPLRERIFEPFYRRPGDDRDAGVGLGLALVRQIARRHGGDARCVDEPGGGTAFEVDLAGGLHETSRSSARPATSPA